MWLTQVWSSLTKLFHDSEVVFLARFNAVLGLLIAAAAGMNWAPLLALTGFDPKQLGITGGLLFFQGLVYELARRRRSSTDPIVPPVEPDAFVDG